MLDQDKDSLDVKAVDHSFFAWNQPDATRWPLFSCLPSSNEFLLEADRNSAIETMVRIAKQKGLLNQAIRNLRMNPAVTLSPHAFGQFDRSLTEFNSILAAAGLNSESASLLVKSVESGVSLTEVVAERFDPEELKVVRGWYAIAREAIRHDIRLTLPEGNRIRFLSAIPANPNDPRAIHFPTYFDEWQKPKSAVVLWVDLTPTNETRGSQETTALRVGTLAGFLVGRAARVLTSAVLIKKGRLKWSCLNFPRMHKNESGEGYFRRVAESLIRSGVTRVEVDETIFRVTEANESF
jgi:hypothetical protein